MIPQNNQRLLLVHIWLFRSSSTAGITGLLNPKRVFDDGGAQMVALFLFFRNRSVLKGWSCIFLPWMGVCMKDQEMMIVCDKVRSVLARSQWAELEWKSLQMLGGRVCHIVSSHGGAGLSLLRSCQNIFAWYGKLRKQWHAYNRILPAAYIL